MTVHLVTPWAAARRASSCSCRSRRSSSTRRRSARCGAPSVSSRRRAARGVDAGGARAHGRSARARRGAARRRLARGVERCPRRRCVHRDRYVSIDAGGVEVRRAPRRASSARRRSRRRSATRPRRRPSGSHRSPTAFCRTSSRRRTGPTTTPRCATRSPSSGRRPPRTSAAAAHRLKGSRDLATARFFAPEARTRIAVVLTDGESQPFAVERTAAALPSRPDPIGADPARPRRESGCSGRTGRSESYRPDRGAGVELARVAGLLHASAYFRESRAAVVGGGGGGRGRGTASSNRARRRSARWRPCLRSLALFPVAFLLWRRNLG